MPFKKGQPRPKNAGRKPGSKNKVTANVKAALVEAFDELGGVPSLVKWGKKNPSHFYAIWSKLLPTEVKNPDGDTFRIGIGADVRRRLAEVDGDGPGQPGEAGGALPAELADPAAPAGDQPATAPARAG
jgi:hypothetical protein